MKAYDIEILRRPADRTGQRDDGWCFGLPPGISPEQWPLDPTNGYPLMHVFTIRLPEDYRCHGLDIAALSFFAIAPDHNDGGPSDNPAIQNAIASAASSPPSDPQLRPFWEAEQRRHPRLHHMVDILDCPYAAILLTQAEFDGPLWMPPRLRGPVLGRTKAPRWLAIGAAAAYWETTYSPALEMPAEDYGIYKMLGGIPPQDLTFNLALAFTPRQNDPNAGKAPREDWSGAPTEYVKPFYFEGRGRDGYREHAWAKDHKPNHIGGTMYPAQAIPAFSPFYVEFGEEVGGCNFGGGNAQLDVRDMKFDWACG